MFTFINLFLRVSPYPRSIKPSTICALSIIHRFSYNYSSSAIDASTANPQNPILLNYLVESFGFHEPRALSISDRYSRINAIDKPESVVYLLKSFELSDAHIRYTVFRRPAVLFSNPEKVIKPKLQFLQELGLHGSRLGEIVSKNPLLLTSCLDTAIKPLIHIFKKIIVNDKDNENLIRVLRRSGRFLIGGRLSLSRITSNSEYLRSCGITSSKLSKLFVRHPRLFGASESIVWELVSRALDMGFVFHSTKFACALFVLRCLSMETITRKFELIRSFGYSQAECLQMFRILPEILGCSEKKLKLGFNFFLNTLKLESSILVNSPSMLGFSLQDRVIPRYRVFQIIKLKKLLSKMPRFTSMVTLNEERFMEKYISRFVDHADELLVAYEGKILTPLQEH